MSRIAEKFLVANFSLTLTKMCIIFRHLKGQCAAFTWTHQYRQYVFMLLVAQNHLKYVTSVYLHIIDIHMYTKSGCTCKEAAILRRHVSTAGQNAGRRRNDVCLDITAVVRRRRENK